MVDIQKAELVYEGIKETLKGQEGQIIAIDPESGDYFIGRDTMEAYEKGHKKHPEAKFLFKRIGARATYFIGTAM